LKEQYFQQFSVCAQPLYLDWAFIGFCSSSVLDKLLVQWIHLVMFYFKW